jgi:hypothetical protein
MTKEEFQAMRPKVDKSHAEFKETKSLLMDVLEALKQARVNKKAMSKKTRETTRYRENKLRMCRCMSCYDDIDMNMLDNAGIMVFSMVVMGAVELYILCTSCCQPYQVYCQEKAAQSPLPHGRRQRLRLHPDHSRQG